MILYTFNAYDEEIAVTADMIEDELRDELLTDGMSELGNAYTIANRALLWSNPRSKEGAWFPVADSKTNYVWVEGNFFD